MKLEVFSHYNGVSENIRYKNDELLYYEKVIISKGCKFEYNNLNGIKFECDKKDNIVVYVYKAKLVSADENITQAKFLIHQSILSDDNFEVTCKRISK